MTIEEVDRAIGQHPLDVFLRRWGDTGWRNLVADVGSSNDPRLLQLIQGVAGIEDDAFYMQVKLRQLGVLRLPSIEAYNSVWLTEEVDHGRAFAALAAKLLPEHSNPLGLAHGSLARDRRAVAALPAMRIVRHFRKASLAGYLVRGALVEYVAIAVYGSLMRYLKGAGEDAGAELVRRILVQEGRHLKFFTSSASIALGTSRTMSFAVRRSTEATWRPPGVDLYGIQRWKEIFQPIFDDPDFSVELVDVDSKVASLPGFEHSRIVSDYLDRV